MGYTKPIETANAIYVLSLENHHFPDYSYRDKHRPDVVVHEGPGFSSGELAKLEEILRAAPDLELLYKRIPSLRERLATPSVALDPFLTNNEIESVYSKMVGGSLLNAAGLVLLAKGVARRIKKKPSRRQLLIGGSALAAGNTLEPLFDLLNIFPGEINARAVGSRISESIRQRTSPLAIASRNAIIAEKLEETIAPYFRKKLGKKPLIVIQIGGSHSGIEADLRSREHRLKTIRKNASKINAGMLKEWLDRSDIYEWNFSTKKFHTESFSTPVREIVSKSLRTSRMNTTIRQVAAVYSKRKKEPLLSRRALLFPSRRRRG